MKWTREQDEFVTAAAERGVSNIVLVAEFQAEFPGARVAGAIVKRRSSAGLRTPVEQPVDPWLTVREGLVERSGNEVRTVGSETIRNPEQLFAASGLDAAAWEIVPGSGTVRKRDAVSKIDGDSAVVELYSVTIKVQRTLADLGLPAPIKVEVSMVRRAARRKDPSAMWTSIHFGDEHFPHADEQALEILYKVADDLDRIDFVAAHGDVLDAEQLSRFPKDPNTRVSMADEITMGAKHLATMRELSPGAQRVYLEGNHESRVRKTIWDLCENNRSASELLTLPEVAETLTWKSLLGLADDWEVVEYTGAGSGKPNFFMLNDILCLKHGDVVRASGSGKGEFAKLGVSGMSGHTHRMSAYYHSDMLGEYTWHELGMLGKVRSDYTSFAAWQQGFAVASWSDDLTSFSVEQVRIIDGAATFRGKRYVG